jgi:hypothetical protein
MLLLLYYLRHRKIFLIEYLVSFNAFISIVNPIKPYQKEKPTNKVNINLIKAT